jgi:hypothetical protein
MGGWGQKLGYRRTAGLGHWGEKPDCYQRERSFGLGAIEGANVGKDAGEVDVIDHSLARADGALNVLHKQQEERTE